MCNRRRLHLVVALILLYYILIIHDIFKPYYVAQYNSILYSVGIRYTVYLLGTCISDNVIVTMM